MSTSPLDWSAPDGPGSAWGRYAGLTAASRAHDEVVGPEGVRDDQQLVAAAVEGMGLSGLLAARAEAHRLAQDDGVHYGGDLQGRRWVVDPVPVVLGGSAWARLEAGLRQRAQLLDLLLTDVYGDRRLVHEGIVPAEVLLGHGGFLHQAQGVRLPGEHQLVLTGTDLARGSDGEWFVLADRTGVPSGAGYAMVTRRITSRVMADLHRNTRLTRLRGFFDQVRDALQRIAPPGGSAAKIALLWPGSGSETAFEMGYLATMLGLSLVEGDDLVTRDGRVLIDSPDGVTPIDVLLRRVDSGFCDPLEWRAESQLGVPGLLEASRRGRVSVANPLGSRVLENPGLMPFLPAVARHLLAEDLLLPSTETHWCGESATRGHVLNHLDELVLKPISREVGAVFPVLGWTLSSQELDELRRRIEREPWAWVGQDPMLTSTAPVVTSTGLEPRGLVLRAFGVATGAGYQFMPGGLGRVAGEPNAFVVSNMAGALAKDVWVLDDSSSLPDQVRAEVRAQALWVEGHDDPPLAPRVADNLFWFGRYAERADSTARLVRLATNLSDDHAARPGTTGHATLTEVARVLTALTGLVIDEGDDPVQARTLLRRLAVDAQGEGSLAFALRRLAAAAHEVPTVMSSDVWHVLGTIERTLADLDGAAGDFQAGLLAVQQSVMALFGVVGESFVRDQSWAFIDAGVRVERAIGTLSLVGVAFTGSQTALVADRVADVVVEACDSLITHRRRSAAGVGPVHPPHSVVALLLLDASNPRAVVHQLERLLADLTLLRDDAAAERVRAVRDRLVAAGTSTFLSGTTREVWELALELADEVRGVAVDLSRRHFTRAVPPRPLPTPWLSQVPPRLEGRL